MDANNVVIEGTIDRIRVHETQTMGGSFIQMMLSNYRGKDKKTRRTIINKIDIQGFVSSSQAGYLTPGKKIRIIGKLNFKTFQQQEETISKTFVFMDHFEFVNSPEYVHEYRKSESDGNKDLDLSKVAEETTI